MPIRLGRWHIEVHRRGLWITREPDPDCPHCRGGRRAWWIDSPYDEPCPCLNQLRTWRLHLWPRRPIREEYPF
ncbi:hypothetical protein [Streptomyces odontomachi]|uniref:hypothetical protein n=1 Tax=Streptomyces odontomachi TaxID=2944940 RepID=UPI00210B26FD|nr:hypothetical protein [Streptomyces sp. ODS25]